MSKRKEWSVYMLMCKGGSLYTGIAKDVSARWEQHRSGRGAAYTRSHRPLRLAHKEGPYTHSVALKREAAIKKLARSAKLALIKSR